MIGFTQRFFLGFLAVLLLGFVLRCVVLPKDVIPSTDSCAYLVAGKNLVTGKGYLSIDGKPETLVAPLFPVAAGIAYRIVGDLSRAGVLATLFFGTLLVPAVYLLAWLLFRDYRTALGAGIVIACHPRAIEMSVNTLSEGVYIFFLLAAMAVFVLAIQKEKRRWYFCTGIFTGLAYLTRAIGFFYIFVFFLAVMLGGKGGWRSKSSWLDLALLMIGFMTVSFPYVAYLHTQTGVWSMIPPAGSLWWALILDYERNVYGSQPGSLSNPIYHSMFSACVHQPKLLLNLLSHNFRHLFIDRFGVVFPPWFFLPASLGFLFAPTKDAKKNLFLVSMALPLGVQLLHNFNFRYAYPLVPILALWVPQGIVVMVSSLKRWFDAVGLFGISRIREIMIGRALWACMLVLFIVPPLIQGVDVGENAIEHKKAGIWLKDAWGPGKVIMARKPWVSFFSDGLWHAIPYENEERVLEEAKKLGAEFLVIDERTITKMRPQLVPLLSQEAQIPGWEKVYEANDPQRIILYHRTGAVR